MSALFVNLAPNNLFSLLISLPLVVLFSVKLNWSNPQLYIMQIRNVFRNWNVNLAISIDIFLSPFEFSTLSDITQLLWWLIVLSLLSGLVRLRVFQLAVKLGEISERKCLSNWKVQASAPRLETSHFYTGKPNVNKIDSCLVTSLVE